ncbi:AraC family transcriptional regulator [Aquimarina algiphila]|uniref:Helix-turn-helix domain-containing protein n=1 Tax=Aquimarina algiphila TaxID=2047982 RepID=A0A554VN52_9FLAO|nr:AraC family transcriptional regulator [Aquimarina algiphila]TSE09772.1 helix-turn-helix domain-containing protein [Aquimarina algiphila]
MKQEITIIIAVLCLGLQSYAKQEIQKEVESDSLSNKTYKQLQNSLIKNIQDSIKSTSYAIAILKKGKKERDTIQILNGFFFLSTINENNDNVLSYSDSIIKISKKINNSRFLGMSFLNKGVYFYEKREFDKSLDNFLTAKLYVDSLPRLNYITEYSIGLLKSRVGEYQEALEIFKKSWMYANERNFKEKDNNNYLITLLSLADGYVKVGKNDSATFYNRLGIEESLFSGNNVKYYDFVLNEGINKYYLKKYDVSYDSISKVIKNFRMKIDRPNLILAYYYYAKTLLEKEEIDSAIVNFKKVDSLFNITNDIHPKSRETYEFLINYYKSKNDDKNQLLYIERLLKVDSILYSNYKYLSKKLAREYDTPKLLKEKERVISGLENKNVKVSNQLMLVSILLGVSLLGLIYYYRRQKTLKRRFNEVMNSKIEHNSEKTTANSGAIGISSDIVNDVLQRLEQFENSDAFLNPSITINDLSKQFDTNSKYLSKIINTYKNKNFSNYINDLRINCVVEKLKLDRKFRNYTVKAIGSEVGFNTTQAFSKAFYKSTGIHPSYFVKKIGEMTNEEM